MAALGHEESCDPCLETPRKSFRVPKKGSSAFGFRSAEDPKLSPKVARDESKHSLDKLFAQPKEKQQRLKEQRGSDKRHNDAAQAALSDRRRQMEAVIESLKQKQAQEALLEAAAKARVLEAESKAELATAKVSQMTSQLYVRAAQESDVVAIDALAQTHGNVEVIADRSDRVPDLIAKLVKTKLPNDDKSGVADALGRQQEIADVVKRLMNSQIQDAIAEVTFKQVAAEANPPLQRPWTIPQILRGAALAGSGLTSVAGGAIGSIFGAAAGAACGIPFAPFTLGLSIPLGAALFASVGMAVCSTTGAVAGGVGGYVAGLAACKLQSGGAGRAKIRIGAQSKSILEDVYLSGISEERARA